MKRLVYSSALLVLLPLTWRVCGAQSRSTCGSATRKAADKTSEYLGSEACMACHEEVATKFAQNPHSRIALMHGGQGSTCESCPGPGKEHVEAGGHVTRIFRFSHASDKPIDSTGSLGNVQRVDVLPFHQMGRFKWKQLKLNYALSNIEPPSVEAVKRACAEFRSAGLKAF